MIKTCIMKWDPMLWFHAGENGTWTNRNLNLQQCLMSHVQRLWVQRQSKGIVKRLGVNGENWNNNSTATLNAKGAVRKWFLCTPASRKLGYLVCTSWTFGMHLSHLRSSIHLIWIGPVDKPSATKCVCMASPKQLIKRWSVKAGIYAAC